jgi:pyruvate/2-oxoglutarate dehydrogenase complex dihydrolipoamide acyltransferase (E2) component
MITSTSFKLTDTALPRSAQATPGRSPMMATTSPYVPESDIYETLADGRVVLVARAGVPVPIARARQLGLVKDAVPAGPTNVKTDAPPLPLEAPVADATEAALELATAHGIDLSTVKGTGAGGRIIKSDVEALLED